MRGNNAKASASVTKNTKEISEKYPIGDNQLLYVAEYIIAVPHAAQLPKNLFAIEHIAASMAAAIIKFTKPKPEKVPKILWYSNKKFIYPGAKKVPFIRLCSDGNHSPFESDSNA